MLLLFSACKKKDEAAVLEVPTITNMEIGTANIGIGYPGHDLHLEAMINAPAKIATIKLQITPVVSGRGFSFSKTFIDGYVGLKNTEFHEHIDIPADVLTGDCDLLLIVTDQAGKRTEIKAIVKIVKDATLPNIIGLQVNLSSGSIAAVTLKGTASAPNKIARLVVEVQSTAWTREFTFIDSDMVGQLSYSLDKNIDISTSPVGHYHINITLVDQLGKQIGFSYHFDKK